MVTALFRSSKSVQSGIYRTLDRSDALSRQHAVSFIWRVVYFAERVLTRCLTVLQAQNTTRKELIQSFRRDSAHAKSAAARSTSQVEAPWATAFFSVLIASLT